MRPPMRPPMRSAVLPEHGPASSVPDPVAARELAKRGASGKVLLLG